MPPEGLLTMVYMLPDADVSRLTDRAAPVRLTVAPLPTASRSGPPAPLMSTTKLEPVRVEAGTEAPPGAVLSVPTVSAPAGATVPPEVVIDLTVPVPDRVPPVRENGLDEKSPLTA